MSLRATLRDRLMTVWAGDPWHGSSSKKILEDITASEALQRPLAGAQSIWECTLHLVAWTEEVTSRLSGAPAKAPARGDWSAMSDPSPAAWSATLAELKAARLALLAAIEKSHEEDLYTQILKPSDGTPSPPMTRAQTISGLVDHDIYHLGQIAMLKKAVRHAATR